MSLPDQDATDQGPALALGCPVNLLAGLRPVFPGAHLPWLTPALPPLTTEPIVVPDEPVTWNAPTLSLHHGMADLLSAIFDYRISPMTGIDGHITTDSGPLMTREGLAPFAKELGIGLNDRWYLLAQIKGTRGTTYFTPEFLGLNRKHKIIDWVTPAGRKAMARLRLQEMRREGALLHGDITARQAQRYLAFFDQMGTHVLRSLSFGEMLYQVFEVAADQAQGLGRIFDQEADAGVITGPAAFGLRGFTRAPWVTGTSPLITSCTDSAATVICADPIWQTPDGPPSLISASALDEDRREAALSRLPARSPIAASFACQALYLEDHRAEAWTRVLRGAMSQRFPALACTGWRTQGAFDAARFLDSAALSGAAALRPGPDAARLGVSFALALAAPDQIAHLRDDHLTLFADADPGSGGPVRIPGGRGFDPDRFTAPFVDGAIEVRAKDGARTTLVEGLWLGEGPDGALIVVADPAIADNDKMLRHVDTLGVYVRILDQMLGPIFAPEAHAFAIRCAEWLARTSAEDVALAPLHWAATNVAKGHGWALNDPGPSRTAMAQAVQQALSLMALAPQMAAVASESTALAAALSTLYRAAPDVVAPATLAASCDRAATAVSDACAAQASDVNLSANLRSVFRAGAGLSDPPNHHDVPHAPLWGAHPVPVTWNAVMTLRTQMAATRAVLSAIQGDKSSASKILAREPMPPRLAVEDPVRELFLGLEQLGYTTVVAAETTRHAMGDLGKLARKATLLYRSSVIDAAPPASNIDPQLLRLIVVLELLNLCHIGALPVAPLTDLAPQILINRLEVVLTALEN